MSFDLRRQAKLGSGILNLVWTANICGTWYATFSIWSIVLHTPLRADYVSYGDNQGTYRCVFLAVAATGGRVRSFVRGGEPLLRPMRNIVQYHVMVSTVGTQEAVSYIDTRRPLLSLEWTHPEKQSILRCHPYACMEVRLASSICRMEPAHPSYDSPNTSLRFALYLQHLSLGSCTCISSIMLRSWANRQRINNPFS